MMRRDVVVLLQVRRFVFGVETCSTLISGYGFNVYLLPIRELVWTSSGSHDPEITGTERVL